jgi:hypothetical protein
MSGLDFGKMLANVKKADLTEITGMPAQPTELPKVTLGSPVQLPVQPAGNIKVSGPQPLSNADQIIGMITNLQQQLQTSAPGYESLLHKIHRALATDEDLVHLLTEEQVGTIVAGLQKRKNIVINTEKAKSGGKGGPRVTVDDL